MNFRPLYSFYSIVVIALSTAVIIWFFTWNKPEIKVINGDGKDYYSYLVSVFINDSLVKEEERGYIVSTPTGNVNIHTIGTALMESPFFIVGYVWAKLGGYELTGYSDPFQKMMEIAAFFYLLIGLFYLRKFLLNMHFSDTVIAIVLPILYFGTNLINFTITEPAMSHIYSFALITSFLYYVHRLFSEHSTRSIYACAFLLGLIIITRSVNGLIIFVVPFFAGSITDLNQKIITIIKDKKRFFISLAILITVFSLQSACWYMQNGKLIQWTYKGYGFYFFDPQIFNILFSFRCGLFIYTPLFFISMFGLNFLFKENRFNACALFLFMLFCVYFFSCWWPWAYFDGIGVRVFTDFLAIIAILLAKFISSLSSRISNFILFLSIAISIFIYQIFYYQYKTGIMPGAGMNYEKLKYIFLKTSDKYVSVVGGYSDFPPYSTQPLPLADSYNNDFEKSSENIETINNNKRLVFKEQEYGADHEFTNDPKNTSCKLYVEISLKRMEPITNSSSEALIVYTIGSVDNDKKYYMNFKMNEVPSEVCCEWKEYKYTINSDYTLSPGDKLKIYIWNKDKQKFYVDDYKINVYRY